MGLSQINRWKAKKEMLEMKGHPYDGSLGPVSGHKSVYEAVKDSGRRQEFETGAVRDVSVGKPRPDKIPIAFLRALGDYFKDHDLPDNCRLDLISIPYLIRLGCHYGNGAKKYAERNWELGIPRARFKESAWRHFLDLMDGLTDEDHTSALAFNTAGPVHFDDLGKSDLIDPPSNDRVVRDVVIGSFVKEIQT